MGYKELLYSALLGFFVVLGVDSSVDYTTEISQKPLKIAAFNVQIFGQNKMKENTTVDILIKIIRRYDIILVQEIRDSSNTSIWQLMNQTNQAVEEDEGVVEAYGIAISERLGRSNSKEQYAYIYRQDIVQVTDTYQYPRFDGGVDVFERPPFVALFKVETASVKEFAMVGIHTKPKDAVNEISNLTLVYQAVKSKWGVEDVLIAGDFNADCNYVMPDEFQLISLYTDKNFIWLINNGDDSTTKDTECSYDRFVIRGTKLEAAIVPGSVKIFHYDKEYKLSKEATLDVSDHYPIELMLEGKMDSSALSHYSAAMSVEINDDQTYSLTIIKSLAMARKKDEYDGYKFLFGYKENSKVEIRWMKTGIADVIKKLDEFRNKHKYKLFSNRTMGYVQLCLQSHLFKHTPYIYGIPTESTSLFDMTVICDYVSPYKCRIQIAKSLTQRENNEVRSVQVSRASSTESELIKLIKKLLFMKKAKNDWV